jgi:DNA-binding transcriptional MerR regulator/methylmalonyl-CoA mutase cobalamin-binding subunit
MLPDMAESGRLRIGELSRRVGVSPELLRAWEARYGLLAPERTAGGLRLYSDADANRVRAMRREIAAGLSAAEAARVALAAGAGPATADEILAELDAAVAELDEVAAHAALDRAFAAMTLGAVVTDVVLPFLRALGDKWASAERTVAEEHFASNVVAGRLRTLARGWGDGPGPRAVLACPPQEQHELGLICFGLLLRERGWRVTYLGAETPLADPAIAELRPDVVVLAAAASHPFADAAAEIRILRERGRVAIGGAGASEALARDLDVELLPGDLVDAAHALGAQVSRG